MGRDINSKKEVAQQQKSVIEHVPAGTLQYSVPVVDLAGIDGPEGQAIREQIAEACQTSGFFHLINHGVDASLIRRTKDVTAEFFHGPEEEKSKVNIQPPAIFGWKHPKLMRGGFNMIRKETVEHLTLAYIPERQLKEYQFPQHPASFKSTLYEYANELNILGEKLLAILSEMLGLGASGLKAAFTTGSANQDTLAILMRSNFYELEEDGEAVRGVCQAHTDSGGLTFLLADESAGLEVKRDGQWLKVDPVPGSFIINVGDMLEICSNGWYKSVEHRAIPSSKQERITLATSQGPDVDCVVGPIESLLDEKNPPRYKTTTFGAYLAGLLKPGVDGKSKLERHKL